MGAETTAESAPPRIAELIVSEDVSALADGERTTASPTARTILVNAIRPSSVRSATKIPLEMPMVSALVDTYRYRRPESKDLHRNNFASLGIPIPECPQNEKKAASPKGDGLTMIASA